MSLALLRKIVVVWSVVVTGWLAGAQSVGATGGAVMAIALGAAAAAIVTRK